jgi:hypothetical protein
MGNWSRSVYKTEAINRYHGEQGVGFDMHPGSAGLRRQSKNCILSSNGEVFFLLTNPTFAIRVVF